MMPLSMYEDPNSQYSINTTQPLPQKPPTITAESLGRQAGQRYQDFAKGLYDVNYNVGSKIYNAGAGAYGLASDFVKGFSNPYPPTDANVGLEDSRLPTINKSSEKYRQFASNRFGAAIPPRSNAASSVAPVSATPTSVPRASVPRASVPQNQAAPPFQRTVNQNTTTYTTPQGTATFQGKPARQPGGLSVISGDVAGLIANPSPSLGNPPSLPTTGLSAYGPSTDVFGNSRVRTQQYLAAADQIRKEREAQYAARQQAEQQAEIYGLLNAPQPQAPTPPNLPYGNPGDAVRRDDLLKQYQIQQGVFGNQLEGLQDRRKSAIDFLGIADTRDYNQGRLAADFYQTNKNAYDRLSERSYQQGRDAAQLKLDQEKIGLDKQRLELERNKGENALDPYVKYGTDLYKDLIDPLKGGLQPEEAAQLANQAIQFAKKANGKSYEDAVKLLMSNPTDDMKRQFIERYGKLPNELKG